MGYLHSIEFINEISHVLMCMHYDVYACILYNIYSARTHVIKLNLFLAENKRKMRRRKGKIRRDRGE